MSGRFNFEDADGDETGNKTAESRLASAFCDGRRALITGVGTNPHVSGSEAYNAWEDGNELITPEGRYDSCAMAIPITMPNLVGLTSAAAQAAILAANLAVGKITGTTGVVTVQAPLAAAKTQPNDVVTFTIA